MPDLWSPFSGQSLSDYISGVIGNLQEHVAGAAHSAAEHQNALNGYNNSLVGTPWEGFYDQLSSQPGYSSGYAEDIVSHLASFIQSGDFKGLQGYLTSISSSSRNFLTPEVEKWLDNMIAQQNTQQNQAWEEQQASTNLLKAGSQLESLGLSSSGVLQTGGSNVNGVNTASNVMSNLAQQNKLAKYNQKMAIARQLLSMTSSMASAGIYGSAIGAAKQAAGVVTSSAAHSAYGAIAGVNRSPSLKKFIEDSSKPAAWEAGSNELPF